MQRLLRKDVVPPDSYRFTHSETAHTSRGPDYWTWMENIRAHRKANNLELPADMDARAEDQLCKQIPPEWCEHSEKAGWVNTRMSFGDVMDGMKAFAKLMLGGFQFVDQAEADRRARICAGCFANTSAQGCGTCRKLASLITGPVAGKRTQYDSDLKVCAICRCVNAAKVWFPQAILDEITTPEQQALFPDFCWQKQEASV